MTETHKSECVSVIESGLMGSLPQDKAKSSRCVKQKKFIPLDPDDAETLNSQRKQLMNNKIEGFCYAAVPFF